MDSIIKSLRKEKALTQVELAKILNLDQTAVSKWENGKALPDSQTLIRLANFFDVSTDYLLGLSTLYYPDRIKEKNAPALSKDEQKIINDYQRLPPDLQRRAVAYMEKLVELSLEEKETNFPQNNNRIVGKKMKNV